MEKKTTISNDTTTPINSISELKMRQLEMRRLLDMSEGRLSNIWNDIFHDKSSHSLTSPTGKAISFLSNSAGVIDGAILGWKLYRKFSSTFKKKKKK